MRALTVGPRGVCALGRIGPSPRGVGCCGRRGVPSGAPALGRRASTRKGGSCGPRRSSPATRAVQAPPGLRFGRCSVLGVTHVGTEARRHGPIDVVLLDRASGAPARTFRGERGAERRSRIWIWPSWGGHAFSLSDPPRQSPMRRVTPAAVYEQARSLSGWAASIVASRACLFDRAARRGGRRAYLAWKI